MQSHCIGKTIKFYDWLSNYNRLELPLRMVLGIVCCMIIFQAFNTVREYDLDPMLRNQSATPIIFVGMLVRNKAHSLPYVLHGIEMQNYPKDRIRVTFIEDNSIDNSRQIIAQWIQTMRPKYRQLTLGKGPMLTGSVKMWTREHYNHILLLRQKLINSAKTSWADFFFSIDADVVLTEPNTLSHLVEMSMNHQLAVIAPLLRSAPDEGYSSFITTVNGTMYPEQPDDHYDIIDRLKVGTFIVTLVHSTFLMKMRLRSTRSINYHPPPLGYNESHVDSIIFAKSGQTEHVNYYVDNRHVFGYVPPPVNYSEFTNYTGSDVDWFEQWLQRDEELFVHLRLYIEVATDDQVRVEPATSLASVALELLPRRSRHGLDMIYYINLERRPSRRVTMEHALEQLGIDGQHVRAVDGKDLMPLNMSELGVKPLQVPFKHGLNSPLKLGEIGCFLSHYKLWNELINRDYDRILILEDDAHFSPGFTRQLHEALREADQYEPNWDLLYIGRRAVYTEEDQVLGTSLLVRPRYSVWTLGYILRRTGALKLINQRPLEKMIPVDEYINVMFNENPHKEWLREFWPRNLVALATKFDLIEPQKYYDDEAHISDTNSSDDLG